MTSDTLISIALATLGIYAMLNRKGEIRNTSPIDPEHDPNHKPASEPTRPEPSQPPNLSEAGPWRTPQAGQPYLSTFLDAGREYNLPHGLLSRIAQQESNYNPAAKGSSGEIGLMQITPRWFPDANPYDPIASIWYAAKLFSRYRTRFGNWPSAISAYNWGPTNTAQFGVEKAPQITQRYISEVLADIGLT